MDSFIFNSFKNRFMQGEVPSTDVWNFSVVNSKLGDYQNIKTFRSSADFVKIGGADKYNKVFTEITPINYYYKELPDLDEDYATKKPMFITDENWKEFYKEYYQYVDDYVNGGYTPRLFYGDANNPGISLHDLFWLYWDTGEVTENGEPVIKNIAKYADFEGFYWVTTKEELAWCAERANGDVNGQRGNTYNNKIAIVLGDDIGTNDVNDNATNIRSCIGRYPDRPFEGLLFGNGYSFVSINLICQNDTNGIVGTLGTGGKIHFCRISGNCSLTCTKKITINHLKNSANDIVTGLLCGKNYGEVYGCEVIGSIKVNDFIPAVYCVQNKTDEPSSNKNPDSNVFYPSYMCINNPGNIIPYIGYFNEGVFGSNSLYQTLTTTEPSGTKIDTCSACYGTGLEGTCSFCRGEGYYSVPWRTELSGCIKCGGTGEEGSDNYHLGRGFSAHICTACSGYGILSAIMPESADDESDISYSALTSWTVPDDVVTKECNVCYGTKSSSVCMNCSGSGNVTEVDEDDGQTYDVTCPVCNGLGISADCPVCRGHIGQMYTTFPENTYSAYMLKQWASSRYNKLDNTGVATVKFNNLSTDEAVKIMGTGAATKGFVTFYDYKQVAKTIELAGLEGTPDYSDALIVQPGTGGGDNPSKIVPLVTTATVSSAYSGCNGYSDTHGSTVPLSTVETVYAGILGDDGEVLNASTLVPVFSTNGQRDELDKACVVGKWGTNHTKVTPPGYSDSYDNDGAKYRWGLDAMPYTMLDQSMKLNTMNRPAYYVSPLVGMNKANIGMCYVNEDFSSSGTFVGFFGGIAGKQTGGWLYNNTSNINASENEERNKFTASAEHAVNSNEGIYFGTRNDECDQLTLFVKKSWDGTINFKDSTGNYVSLDDTVMPTDAIYIGRVKAEDRNRINLSMKRKKRTWWERFLGRSGKQDRSCSDPLLPQFKGFNLSFSAFTGANYIAKTVIDFKMYTPESVPEMTQDERNQANSAYYEMNKIVGVCAPGGVGYDFSPTNTALMDQNYGYGFVSFDHLNHTCYVDSMSGNSDVVLTNYTYNTPYTINPEKTSDAKFRRLSYDEETSAYYLTGAEQKSYDQFMTEYNASAAIGEASAVLGRMLIDQAPVVQGYSAALLNFVDFQSIGNSVQWIREEQDDNSVTYRNDVPITMQMSTFYDIIESSFGVCYHDCFGKTKTGYKVVFGYNDYKVERSAAYHSTKFNLKIKDENGNLVDKDHIYIQAITIDKMVFKEATPIAVETLEGMYKTAQVEVAEIRGITLAGAEYDDTNLTRTDYKIYIDSMDVSDTTNFIDKCTCSIDEVTNRVIYSDKYVRDEKHTLYELYTRKDGIYGYLNKKTWNKDRNPTGIKNIFYYTYYNVNFDDINDYSCTLYSIRNVGALAGSLIVNNKQYIMNNFAYLNNKQGLTFKETSKKVVPYIHVNQYVTEKQKSGVVLNYLGAVQSGLKRYPNYYGLNGSKVYTSNEISGVSGHKLYQIDSKSYNKIAIAGITPQDKTTEFNGLVSEDGTAFTSWNGNELFTYYYDNSSVTGTLSGKMVTPQQFEISGGICYAVPSAVGIVGKYMSNGIQITNDTKVPLYTLATGKTPIMEVGIQVSNFDETTSAHTVELLQVTNLTSAAFTSAFNTLQTSNASYDYSAMSGNYTQCNVTFPDNFPSSLNLCRYTYYTLENQNSMYYDESSVREFYKGTPDVMKPDWKDYNLLNRYGALAAICEYHTSNLSDKVVPGKVYTSEEIDAIRPITLNNNYFAYHEQMEMGEHSYRMGPMKLGKYYNRLSQHVVGHKIYGIASPLIAEIKPVAKAIPSVFQYSNGAMEGMNEAGVFREGYTNQYFGMFTTDMGIRGSTADPYGWVTNDAIDIPGSPNFGINGTSTATMFWNADTRNLACNLFDWRLTHVDPGNITVTGALSVTGYTTKDLGYTKSDVYKEPYDYPGQDAYYATEINAASDGKVANLQYSTVKTKSVTLKYATNGEGTPGIGYGFTYDPVATITVPFNSYKDTLGNKYPAGIYGFCDITRYKDIDDTVCEYDTITAKNSIYRPDLEQLQNPWNDYPNPWELFKNRKHKNRYPYFGSSLRLLRDDEADFIAIPGYNNVRDGKYINDCVPSYTNAANTPLMDGNVPEGGYPRQYNTPINIKPESEYTFDKFEYTYEQVAGTPFTTITNRVWFEDHNDKIGYWLRSTVSAGFSNDYITYSAKEVKYAGNVLNLGYTKIPDRIRTEIVSGGNDYSFTSGISGTDIEGILVQDSIGNNVMYISLGLGDCNGLQTWAYSAYPSQFEDGKKIHGAKGCKGLLLEIN